MSSWILTRNDTQEQLSLHPQLYWQDEFDWTKLAQSAPEYTLGGAIVLEQGTKLAGRTITLNSNYARFTRAEIRILQIWSEVPELEIIVTHPDGRTFTVCFDRPAISDISAIRPVRGAEETDTDIFHAILRFITL